MYARSRAVIGWVYAWRAENGTDAQEKKRMERVADFAFRQAWALCPYSPDATYRYLNFLLEEKRYDDAILVGETALGMPENNAGGPDAMLSDTIGRK